MTPSSIVTGLLAAAAMISAVFRDNPLNDDGIAQAHAAARRLHDVPFDHVVASPLLRAVRP